MTRSSTVFRWFSRIAAGATALLLIVLIVMGAELMARLDNLKAAPTDSIQWGLAQVLAEFNRFHLALHKAEDAGDVDMAQVRKRFDILYSRVDLFRTAPVYKVLREDPQFAVALGSAYHEIARLALILDRPGEASETKIKELLTRVEDGAKNFNDLVQKAIVKFAEIQDAERESLSTFIRRVGYVGFSLLALLLSAVFFYVLQGRALAQREAALLDSKERMSATYRVATDAIVVADRNSRIIDYNDAAVATFGYSRDDALGRVMAELLIPAHHRDRFRADTERVLSSEHPRMTASRVEFEALHADGHEIPVELGLGMSGTASGPILIAFLRDITERRKYEASLRKSMEEAQAGERAKSRFLAVMSHEIRTPLNGVIGTMELLRNTRLDTNQSHYVDIATVAGETLFSVINDILDLSRMNASGLQLLNQHVAIEQLVTNAVEVVAAGAADNGNQIAIDIAPDIPRDIHIDGDRLRQVLLNFLSNAQKFTRGGDIQVSVRRMGGSEDVPLVEFAVTDTGIGFDPALADDLFKDFSTLDSSHQRKAGGTGLGLAISKRIVLAMGGEIGADGKLGHGSRFWFRIGLPVAETPDRKTIVKPSPEMMMESLSVLLVDDNLTNLLVTRSMLTTAGHRVEEARNGLEAVAKGMATVYDIILMDISMPEVDGLEATRRLRASGTPGGSVPIVALTASVMKEDVDRALEAGMNGFASKPIRRAELLKEIGRVVETRGAISAPVYLDTNILSELMGEIGEDIVKTLLSTFAAELQTLQTGLPGLLQGRDLRGLEAVCHSIAGSAATMGAMVLAEHARILEQRCKARAVEDVNTRGSELMSAIDHTRVAVAERLGKFGLD